MEFVLPIIFIAAGLAMVIYPKQIGFGFSRLGRTIWKNGTFGLTDMRWFYPKDGAPYVFRFMGFGWILIGSIFLLIIGISLFGPNSFAAIREAKSYLKYQHGNTSSGYSISASWSDHGQNSVVVRYRYGEHSGSLIGLWNGDHYEFAEQTPNAEQVADDQLPARIDSETE